MGVAKSDFSQVSRSRSYLIKNAEHFARIDLDRSRFEKKNATNVRNHSHCFSLSLSPTLSLSVALFVCLYICLSSNHCLLWHTAAVFLTLGPWQTRNKIPVWLGKSSFHFQRVAQLIFWIQTLSGLFYFNKFISQHKTTITNITYIITEYWPNGQHRIQSLTCGQCSEIAVSVSFHK